MAMHHSRTTSTTSSYAGLWLRLSAFALDYLAIALYLALIIVLGLALRAFSPDWPSALFGDPVSAQITSFLTITVPVTVYFALLESSSWQATWGKRRLGLKVIGPDGRRLSRARAIGRTVLKFIPWELAHTCIWQVSFARQETSSYVTTGFVLVWALVGANVLSLLISKSRQTLYDRIARTYVVAT